MDREPPDVPDEELARQSQAGSLVSFEELVYRYEQRIFRFLARCCRNEEDARELAQTAFVTAYRSLHLYQPDRPFGPWLFAVARRKFLDHCRSLRPGHAGEGLGEPSDLDDPAEILARREEQEDTWAWVRAALAPSQFSALWLRYQEEMSIRDIARALDRTQTSVKVLLFRARQALVRASANLSQARTTAKSAGRAPANSRPATLGAVAQGLREVRSTPNR